MLRSHKTKKQQYWTMLYKYVEIKKRKKPIIINVANMFEG
jgi:hypothetical protein